MGRREHGRRSHVLSCASSLENSLHAHHARRKYFGVHICRLCSSLKLWCCGGKAPCPRGKRHGTLHEEPSLRTLQSYLWVPLSIIRLRPCMTSSSPPPLPPLFSPDGILFAQLFLQLPGDSASHVNGISGDCHLVSIVPARSIGRPQLFESRCNKTKNRKRA